MNELLKITQAIQQLAADIEKTEKELKTLEEKDCHYIDSVSLQYIIPINETHPVSGVKTVCEMDDVVFNARKKHDVKEIVECIKRMYKADLEEYYKRLGKYTEILKNAPSSATNTEQGNA